jgi:hypothetical protein
VRESSEGLALKISFIFYISKTYHHPISERVPHLLEIRLQIKVFTNDMRVYYP